MHPDDDVIVARYPDSNPGWIPAAAYAELLAEMEDIVSKLQAQIERERRAYMGSICYRLRVWWWSL